MARDKANVPQEATLTDAELAVLAKFRANQAKGADLPDGFIAVKRTGQGTKTKGQTMFFVALNRKGTVVEIALNVAESLRDTFKAWPGDEVAAAVTALDAAIVKVKAAKPPRKASSTAGYSIL